jgi:hypothetical protein
MMKSLLMWPEMQYIVTSYRDEFCKRDTIRMRDLVMSPWYQMLFGDNHEIHFINPDATITTKIVRGVQLVATGETRISNTVGGFREGIPFKSLTGNRAAPINLCLSSRC